MDREAWRAAIHGVVKSWTRLSDIYFTFTPWKESYDQPRQHIKKQRYYFVNKGPSSQGQMVFPKLLVFPVFMYGCESWTIKKAEC